MFTNTQIEAAVETLGVPFNYPELEALRKIALWAMYQQSTHRSPARLGKARRPRPAALPTKIEDILTSNEPPTILIERHGYTMATIRAIKAGYGIYSRFGGGRYFWPEYRRLYRGEIGALLHPDH